MIKVIILGGDSPDAPCSVCGEVSELRPYGKDGALICFDCGMKDEETTDAMFKRVLDGEDLKQQPNQNN